MKKSVLTVLIFFALISTSSFAQKLSRSQLNFSNEIQEISDRELWEWRLNAQEKIQSNTIMAAVNAGWGLSGVLVGVAFYASGDEALKEGAGSYLGAGALFSVISIVFATAAKNHRKKDVLMQRELMIRGKEIGLRPIPGGVTIGLNFRKRLDLKKNKS